MFSEFSDKTKDLRQRLKAFMDSHIYPNEAEYYRQLNAGERWKVIPLVEQLKEKAKAEGLWNLFLPESAAWRFVTTWLAAAYAHIRTLRLADGPDEVHREVIARLELRKES